MNAKDLKAGDKLKSSKGKLLKISSVRTQKSRAVVYNFTVADYHTYFVSNLGVWVHNTQKCNVDPPSPEQLLGIKHANQRPRDSLNDIIPLDDRVKNNSPHKTKRRLNDEEKKMPTNF